MASKLKSMKGATAGSITLRLFRDLPPAQAGWLAAAWSRYVEDGEEPDEVPPENLGAWIAAKEEADRIKELSDIRAEIGRKGADVTNSKTRQNAANVGKVRQTSAKCGRGEERRVEENILCNTSEKREASGHIAGADAPAPLPAPPSDKSIPAELVAAMSDAPISAEDAMATAAASGLTEAQLLDWAHYHAARGWNTNVGSAILPMNRKRARASIGSWASKERSFANERKARGVGVDGDVTIRGVRVANKGDGLGDVGF